jgi:hypothetical protein
MRDVFGFMAWKSLKMQQHGGNYLREVIAHTKAL